jgi:hypothetical protein
VGAEALAEAAQSGEEQRVFEEPPGEERSVTGEKRGSSRA